MADYSDSFNYVQVNLAQGTGAFSEAQGDTLTLIEEVWGSAYSDYLIGSGADDALVGNAGNDTLSGGDGNDVVLGGAGADMLYGGAGSDGFVFGSLTDSAGDRIWDFAEVE